MEAAAFFGMSVGKFRKLLNGDSRVLQAWEAGKEQGKISLRRKQHRLAATNAQMAIHLGKQYLGQADKGSLEISGPAGGPVEMDLTKLKADERKQLRHLLSQSQGDSSAAG